MEVTLNWTFPYTPCKADIKSTKSISKTPTMKGYPMTYSIKRTILTTMWIPTYSHANNTTSFSEGERKMRFYEAQSWLSWFHKTRYVLLDTFNDKGDLLYPYSLSRPGTTMPSVRDWSQICILISICTKIARNLKLQT